MRTNIGTICTFTASATLALLGAASTAQADQPAVYMATAVARVGAAVRLVTDNSDFGFDNGLSLLGAFIHPQSKCSIERTLAAGETYAFVGAGDDDARAINIVVRRASSGVVVAKDVKPNRFAMVSYRPSISGVYEIELRLSRAQVSSFCSLGILRKGGWSVPTNNLATAVARALAAGEVASRGSRKSVFLDVRNQWSLFGGVLRSGEGVGMGQIVLTNGKHVFCAGADEHAEHVGLKLIDDHDHTVEEDTDNDTAKMFEANTSSDHPYGVRISNENSDGPSMVVGVVVNR